MLLVVGLVGTGLYAASLSLVFGAMLLTAGTSHAEVAGLALGSTSMLALTLEVFGVALAGTLTGVLATRSATVSPRWWPPLLTGLAAGAVYWGLTIATTRSDELFVLYLWPTHLKSWLALAGAQLAAVNLGPRRS